MWWTISFTLLIILLRRSAGDSCPCTSVSEKQLTRQPLQFNEGENVIINVEGDIKNGRGCQVLHKKDQNIICCYIHKTEEDKRAELCATPTQHKRCRKNETYVIEEIVGRIGNCSLTLYKGEEGDSGVYEIVFPGAQIYNTTREVRIVKGVLFYWWERLLIILFSIAIFISLIGVYRRYLKTWFIKKEKHQREKDGFILNKFKNDIVDGFQENFTKRNIFGLRDKNDNNIIHIAAAKSEWSEQMINIVLGPQQKDNEALMDKEEDAFRKLSSRLFSISKWVPNFFPYYLVPDRMMHLNISLNSKNSEGNTPLIIAAKQNKIQVIRVLLDKKVRRNIKNNEGYTALHQAVTKGDQQVLRLLLEKGAKKDIPLPSGKTPLHTAVQNKDIDIVKILIPNIEEGDRLLSRKKKSGEHGSETPLQLAVRLGFLDIVDFLIKDKRWQTREDWRPMLYTSVAGGHKKILKLLITNGWSYQDSWDGISSYCLMKVVEDNNKTAVNTLFNTLYSDEDFPDKLPANLSSNQSILILLQGLAHLEERERERERETALKLAREKEQTIEIEIEKIKSIITKLENEGGEQQEEPDINAERETALISAREKERKIEIEIEKIKSIIKKLENEGGEQQEEPEENESNTDKNSEIKTKKEYMKFVKALKAKSNKKVMDDLDEDLARFANLHWEITQKKQTQHKYQTLA